MSAALDNVSSPLVRFYRLVPGARSPKRADDDAGGTIPARAHKSCRPLCRASAFGWHVFPPMRFRLIWDGGSQVLWSHSGAEGWERVHVVQVPGFPLLFDRVAPLELRPFAPPLLVALGQTGIVQVWTGLLVRTAPGCNLVLRSPINTARSKAYELFEVLLPTDRQLTPLFMKIRLTRTDAPIEFEPDLPVAQVQPIDRRVADKGQDFKLIPELGRFTVSDWVAFRESILERQEKPRTVPISRAAIGGKIRIRRLSRASKR